MLLIFHPCILLLMRCTWEARDRTWAQRRDEEHKNSQERLLVTWFQWEQWLVYHQTQGGGHGSFLGAGHRPLAPGVESSLGLRISKETLVWRSVWPTCKQTDRLSSLPSGGWWNHYTSQLRVNTEDLLQVICKLKLVFDPLHHWTKIKRQAWPFCGLFLCLCLWTSLLFCPSLLLECWCCGDRNQRDASHPHRDKNHHLWVCRGMLRFYLFGFVFLLTCKMFILTPFCPPEGSRVKLLEPLKGSASCIGVLIDVCLEMQSTLIFCVVVEDWSVPL